MPIAFTNTTITAKSVKPIAAGSSLRNPATDRPKPAAPTSSHLNEDFVRPRSSSGPFPWSLGVALLAVALLITVGVSWSQLNARNTLLQEAKNRAEQVAAATTVIQAQLAEAKALTIRLQEQLAEDKMENAQLRTTRDQVGVVTSGLHAELATALTASGDLKRQIEQTKLAASAPQTASAAAQSAEIQRRRSIQNSDPMIPATQVAESQSPAIKPE